MVKRVVSISLGSSRRDHAVTAEFAGEQFSVERIGTDGDIDKACQMISKLDGKVDAIGIGGIDLYLSAGSRRYTIRGAMKLARSAKVTPIVDGSGLKNTLERHVIRWLQEESVFDFQNKVALVVCACDRFGMAESLAKAGAMLILGDLMFTLGLPFPLYSLRSLDRVARIIAPPACQLPLSWLYPIGKSQDQQPKRKYWKYYQRADVIAGDFHLIRRYLPDQLAGKTVITNTVTSENVEELRMRGAATLVTTTPELQGRSFGTNVMEGVLIALSGKRIDEVTESDYQRLLGELGFRPRVLQLEGRE